MSAPYTLPELPYDYSALEPWISGEIMELHHDKHHAAYVKGANDALEQLAEAREKGDLSGQPAAEELAQPGRPRQPHRVLAEPVAGRRRQAGRRARRCHRRRLGSFDAFRAHFSAAATGIQGSGWAILAWDILGQRLIIEQLYDHQGNLAAGSYPLLMLDMWEHAFYLQYKNVKADYVKAFWNVVNWADVAKRFEDARKVALG